ncbi:MAG TPA: hypothetical protein VLJ61_18675 [Pyrinomonadaceae bacterium]|nr:hypothetical protein [Pyrinomonadaceae bacterium]
MPFAFLLLPSAHAQEVVDRMVAVVNERELITYSDLLWQLALQPDVPLDNPRREDLRRALDLLTDQRLILEEAEKLPSAAPTDQEIQDEEKRVISFFPSMSAFYERLSRVGIGSDSSQFREIMQDRVRMRKYLDFRFRAFTVVTQKDVEAYYRDTYVPRFRRQAPGHTIPQLKDVYNQIQSEMVESKVESDTDDFLEQARSTAQITILDESLSDAGQRQAGGGGIQTPGAVKSKPPASTRR